VVSQVISWLEAEVRRSSRCPEAILESLVRARRLCQRGKPDREHTHRSSDRPAARPMDRRGRGEAQKIVSKMLKLEADTARADIAEARAETLSKPKRHHTIKPCCQGTVSPNRCKEGVRL